MCIRDRTIEPRKTLEAPGIIVKEDDKAPPVQLSANEIVLFVLSKKLKISLTIVI